MHVILSVAKNLFPERDTSPLAQDDIQPLVKEEDVTVNPLLRVMTVRNMFCRMRTTGQAGFTILEVLVATIVFSIALVALSSVSFTIMGGNKHSGKFVQASILAQDQIETIRAMGGFNLGADMLLGTADDVIPAQLVNTSTGNDAVTDPATMFDSPDYTEDGSATPLTLTTTPQAAWLTRDNYPIAGMKTVSVVVGWLEGTSENYVVVSTAMQGA